MATDPTQTHSADTPRTTERTAPMDTWPRRASIQSMTPAELKCRELIGIVEELGADVRLTDAVVLIGAAQASIADFIDGVDCRRTVTDQKPIAALRASEGAPSDWLAGILKRDEERRQRGWVSTILYDYMRAELKQSVPSEGGRTDDQGGTRLTEGASVSVLVPVSQLPHGDWHHLDEKGRCIECSRWVSRQGMWPEK